MKPEGIFRKKLKLFHIPFFIAAVGFYGVYTFLHWLLLIQLKLLDINDFIVVFVLPMILALAIGFFYFDRRFKYLALGQGKGSRIDQLYITATMLILFGPTVVLQIYMPKAVGSLTSLVSVKEITERPLSKYYTIQHFFLDKNHIGIEASSEVTGKYNQNLTYFLHYVVPMRVKEADSLSPFIDAWLGVRYSKIISNKLSQKQKEAIYRSFFTVSQSNFDTANLYRGAYLERAIHTNDADNYLHAVRNTGFDGGRNLVLMPHTGRFENRTDENKNLLIWMIPACTLAWIILITIPKLNEAQIRLYERRSKSKKGK